MRLLQTAGKKTGFHTDNAYSMQPHKTEDNNDENDIAAVIIELANAATKDKEKMTATFIDLTHTIMTLQDKIEKVDKKGRSRKKIYSNESYC